MFRNFAVPKTFPIIETTTSKFNHSQRIALHKLYKAQVTLIETGAPKELKTETAKLIKETRNCTPTQLNSLWTRQQAIFEKCSPPSSTEELNARLR